MASDCYIAALGKHLGRLLVNNAVMSYSATLRPLTRPQTLLVLALLPPLVWHGNPAVALLVAAALSLGLDRPLLPQAGKLGKYTLQAAIVLMGLKLNAGQLTEISARYSLLVTAYVVAAIGLGLLMGRLLRNPIKSNQLIASGTAICGGTAIASLSPVIGARPEQTGIALSLVFLLNAVALFTFPAIGHSLSLTQEQFGVWAALAIHDTSSVVATASLYGEEAATVATTVKLGRTLWLIPLLLVFSIIEQQGSARLRLPLFVIAFVLAACLGSLVPIPSEVVSLASATSSALLTIALFCIGMEISRPTLAGLRGPVLFHGLLLWLVVAPLSLVVILWLY